MTANRDTAAVAEFMHAFGQPVRTVPTRDVPDEERLLRVRLVIEEALEFAAAMGCTVRLPATPAGHLDPKAAQVGSLPDGRVDLVEAADALADLTVVTKGSAHTLGVDLDTVFDLVHQANMAKAGPDGKVRRREDGKVLKPEGWVAPNAAIRDLLFDQMLSGA